MKIIDEFGKERDADILKVITHEIEKDGELIPVDFLKVRINGNNFSWKTFIPLEEFRDANPEVEI